MDKQEKIEKTILNRINVWLENKFSNLKETDKFGDCALSQYFKLGDKVVLTTEESHYLINNSDHRWKQENNSFLMLALRNSANTINKLLITDKEWDVLIKNADLSEPQDKNLTPLAYALSNNYYSYSRFNLNNRHWEYLIKNSNLTSKAKHTDIFNLLLLNKIHKTLAIPEKLFNYVIKHADFSQILQGGMNNLMIVINHYNRKIVTDEQLKNIIKKSGHIKRVSIAFFYYRHVLRGGGGLNNQIEKMILEKDPYITKENGIYTINKNIKDGDFFKDTGILEEMNGFLDRINTYEQVNKQVCKNKTKKTNKI